MGSPDGDYDDGAQPEQATPRKSQPHSPPPPASGIVDIIRFRIIILFFEVYVIV